MTSIIKTIEPIKVDDSSESSFYDKNIPNELTKKFKLVKDITRDIGEDYKKPIESFKKRYFIVNSNGIEYFMKVWENHKADNSSREYDLCIYLKTYPIKGVSNIIDVYKDSKIFVVITEKYGVDLFNFIVKKHPYLNDCKNKKIVFRKILDSLKNMYSRKILYTDLKPENVVFDNNLNPVIIDFDMYGCIEKSETINFEKKLGYLTTRTYLAPESEMFNIYNEKTLVWQLGLLLYIIYHGFPPYNGTFYQYYKQYQKTTFYINSNFGQDFSDLISKMLYYDSKNRISLTDIENHKFFLTE